MGSYTKWDHYCVLWMVFSMTTVVISPVDLETSGVFFVQTQTFDDADILQRFPLSTNRLPVNPGDDVSAQSQNVQDFAEAAWTSDVINAWKNFCQILLPTNADLATQVRGRRDSLLAATDYLCLYDTWPGLSGQYQNDLTIYREALRNVPQQAGFPATVNWPVKPSD